MDATQFSSYKTAFLLTLSLLAAAPSQVQAQTLQVPTSISIPAVGSSYPLQVTSSDSTVIKFDVSITYTSNGPAWIMLNGSCSQSATGLTTPATISLSRGCFAGSPGTSDATITLTPTSPAGSPVTITAPLTISGNTGGLTLSPTSVNWTFNTTSPAPASTQITVTTAPGAASYTAQITANSSAQNWLSLNGVIGGPTTASPASPLNLQLNSNALLLGSGNYQATVLVKDSLNNAAALTVALAVNTVGTGISVSQNPIIITAAAGQAFASTTVTVTSLTSGFVTASVNSGNSYLTGVNLSSNLIAAAGGTVQLTVNASATNLSQSTYPGSVLITVGGVSQSFPVNLQVGNGTPANLSTVAPGTLQFNYELNGTLGNSLQQSIMLGGTSGISSITPTPANSWLSVSGIPATAPGQVLVTVNPSAGSITTGGQYQGSLMVIFADGTSQSVTVNLTVTSGTPLVSASPVIFNQPATATPQMPVYLYTTDNSSIPVSVTTSTAWITFVSSPPTPSTAPAAFIVQANTTGLPNGMNTGSITVSYGIGTLTIPVVAYITNSTVPGTGALTLGATSVSFRVAAGSIPQTQSVTVTAPTTTYFTANVVQQDCTQTSWLAVNGATSTAAYTNQVLTISADPTGISSGTTCSGTIQLTASGITQNLPVTLTVGGSLTVSTTPLAFAYTAGGPTSQSQTIKLTNNSVGSAAYTATASTSTGGSWLFFTSNSGTSVTGSVLNGTQYQLGIGVNPAGLAAGTYNGVIAVTSGSTTTNVSVTLTVTGSSISATPTSLSFTYSGDSAPASQTVAVSGGAFTASASSTGNWLSVTPTSGSAAGNITVSVNPAGLAAKTYVGTITITGAGGTPGTATVNVTFTVTTSQPLITAVVNGATFQAGAIAPGEIISIGGTALGPATPATLTLDSSGNVSTSLAGVTVTVGNTLAPLIYVSDKLVSAVVPYEIAGQVATSVVVKYNGQTSNTFSQQAAAVSPGIFTQNSSGSGPGAILNQDYSVNGPLHPAAKGSAVQVFMTGEGLTTPTHVTGKVNNVTSISQLPVPLLSVSASIGGQPAQVTFAAEAPGLVSGVMQVNVIVPATVGSGNQPIVISVGTTGSQAATTVNVQ